MSYICDPFDGIFEIVPRSLHKVGRIPLVAVVVVARPVVRYCSKCHEIHL